MACILVAEDSATQAAEVQFMLEEAGHRVFVARDGADALAMLSEVQPQLVLTDMNMPNVNGLQLVEAVRSDTPEIPVVLMTADGTEQLAVEALRRGAASYIPKEHLQRDLIPTIGEIAGIVQARLARVQVLNALTRSEATYRFGNDPDFVGPFVAHMESALKDMKFDDETSLFRTVLALKEAIVNAIDHGNLELDSALRDDGDGSAYHDLGNQRRLTTPYADRMVTVTSRITPAEVCYVIRDEGPGFDPSILPDPEDPENLLRAHGRGLLLVRSFMDAVSFNAAGNEITIVKHRSCSSSEVAAPAAAH